jgi:hypothetical protein
MKRSAGRQTRKLVQTLKCGYYVRVKFQECRTYWFALFATLCLCAPSALAQNKFIRLRNETIAIHPSASVPTARSPTQNEQPASGLFLIQFSGPLQSAWVEELRGHHVELLRYVPEDAFVARFERSELRQVRALPFVQWIGPYRPEHKVLPSLRQPGGERSAAGLLPVRVLFSPLASPAELAQARALMRGEIRESGSRFGAVLRGTVSARGLDQLAESPAVLWIEPERKMKLMDEVSSRIVGGDGGEHSTHTNCMVTTDGVTVAVADSGLYLGDGARCTRT